MGEGGDDWIFANDGVFGEELSGGAGFDWAYVDWDFDVATPIEGDDDVERIILV